MALDFGPPSGALQRELEEVAAKARALSEHVRTLNFLPESFPRDQLEGICRNLIGLPSGSAEGCCVPLTYARKRLPAIRREYVSARPDGTIEDKEAPPAILRGENLDQFLKDLLASVTTALDQYQVESGVDVADSVDREVGVEGSTIPGIDTAASKAHALELRMNEASKTIEEINQKGARSVESLARQYKDVEIQSGLASAELSMPSVRVSWYQPIVTQLRKMPEVIEKTGKAIRVATDVARPLVQRWNDFKANVWAHVLHEIEETGKTLEQVGRRLRNARDSGDPTPRAEVNDMPADFDLVKARDMLASGIAPPQSWIPWIDRLDFGDKSIDDVELLENLTSLRSLTLNRIYTSDLKSFGQLKSLQHLKLYGYRLDDIGHISALTNLSTLNLEGTDVRDVSPLQSLTKLRVLRLGKTKVSSVQPLRALKLLEQISLNQTPVRDLSALSVSSNLLELDISETKVNDLSPLATMRTLQRLRARGTSVHDLGPLRRLSSLIELDLDGTRVEILDPLSNLTRLARLTLSGTRTTRLDALKRLQALEVLSLEHTSVDNLAPIKNLTNMRQLELDGTLVGDIDAISALSKLKELSLSSTDVFDLSPIQELVSLEDLRLNRTPVADLSPLAKVVSLKMLQLDQSNVEDLSPLVSLENLEELWIDHTPVRDLTPLSKLKRLRTVWINGTRVKDVSCLAKLDSLESIVVGTEGRRQKLEQTFRGREGILKIVQR